ncbi:EF-hand domain-containing protein [Jannaschia aquimarina]|uniref:EF hand n=1 Tax=Jannaschia aquimarina TaxID=935700 RepID=A0A0D1EIC0_9RHOB|nr:EF-hand domain-containing protein [Jannaschia aquimarina]KIT17339.1 EF hand [Jannaschia aquimarina]SNT20551.1 hypothetical protein SAMN05421775_107197 [Jannaschia aquimarina]
MRLPILVAATLFATPALAQDAESEVYMAWAMGPAMEGVDRDGDGRFTQEEIGGTRLDASADADGSGDFDLPELTAALFAMWDTDDSGYLEPEELEAMTGLAAAGVYEIQL